MDQQEVLETIRRLSEEFWTGMRELRKSEERFRQQMEEFRKQIADQRAEDEKRLEELRESDRRLKAAIEGLTGKWGRFVEGMIAPAVVSMFKERGIEVERIFQRVRARRNGKEMEVDILAVNDEYAVLIEAKSTLGMDDVKEHIQRLGSFREFFPEYADRKVVGAVAGIVIEEGADRFAYRNGLFVIGQSGEAAKILNDEKFKPRYW
jgi:hypothetical protein